MPLATVVAMTAAGGEPVLVLGGGLMGLATAHALARRGQAVLVLSRQRSEAAGFVAAGMLAPHAEGLEGVMLELGQRSLDCIPAWVAGIEADSGLSCGLSGAAASLCPSRVFRSGTASPQPITASPSIAAAWSGRWTASGRAG